MKILSLLLFLLLGYSNNSMAQVSDLQDYFNDHSNFTLENYIKLSEGLGYKLEVKEGLMLYGLLEEEIPSDVYFIPIKRKAGQSFNNMIIEAFSNADNIMFDMIFGHLGRTPGLAATLNNIGHEQVYFTKFKRHAKIAYCRFIFNYYYGDFKSEYPTNPNIRKLTVIFDDKAFYMNVKDFSEEENGYPALFEAINF